MKRNLLLKTITMTILAGGLLSTTSFIVNDKISQSTSINDKNNNINNNLVQKESSDIESRLSASYMQGSNNVVSSTTNGISLAENNGWKPWKPNDFSSNTVQAIGNDICTLATDGTNYGILRINGVTGASKLLFNNGTNKIYQMLYLNNCDTLVLLMSEGVPDNSATVVGVRTINANTGAFRSSTYRKISCPVGKPQYSFIEPVVVKGSSSVGQNIRIAVGTRAPATHSRENDSSNAYSGTITIDPTGKYVPNSFKTFNNTNTGLSVDESIVIAQAFYSNNGNEYLAQLLRTAGSDSTLYLKLWDQGSLIYTFMFGMGSLGYPSLSDGTVLKACPPDMYVCMDGSVTNFAIVMQNGGDGYDHTKIVWANTNSEQGIISLDPSYCKWDITSINYKFNAKEQRYNDWATGILLDGSIFQWKMGSWKIDPAFTNENSWKPTSSNSSSNRTNKYIKSPSKSPAQIPVQIENGNIAWTYLDNSTNSFCEIIPIGAGRWAYNSFLSSSIVVPNANDILASALTDSQLKQYADKYLLKKLSYSSSNSTIQSVVGVNTTEDDVYLGQKTATVVVNNAFVEGTLSTGTYTATFTGFHEWTTELINNSIDVSKIDIFKDMNSTSITKTDIIDYLWNNKETYFSDLPVNFNKTDIDIKTVTTSPSTGIKIVDIVLKKYVGSDHVLKNNSTGFVRRFTLSGFVKTPGADIGPSLENGESSSGLPSWIWYAVGGGSAVLVIVAVIVAIIISKKKKAAKNIKKVSSPLPRSNPRIGTSMPSPSQQTPVNRPTPGGSPKVPPRGLSPTPRPGASLQRPGAQRPAAPMPPKVTINTPPKSFSPKRK